MAWPATPQGNLMQAIRVNQPGGPDALSFETVDDPTPAADQALVRMEAVGVNFIDIYQRSGQYPLNPPFTLGMEGAGVVEAVGPDVSGLSVGDRVAHAMQLGSYAELQAVPAANLVKLPEGIDTHQAAAAMLQGMTAHYLAHTTFPLAAGHTALVHAGAGGVGRLLIQMAKRAGARVIATAGAPAKAEIAAAAGADEVINYTEADFLEEVRRLTNGAGVDVVYDSVGVVTYERSFDCLKPRGLLALYGASSGPVPPLDAQILNAKGSLFLTRPSLGHYTLTRDELEGRAGDVLSWIEAGDLILKIDREVPLAQAADAHRALQGRETSGKVLLIP